MISLLVSFVYLFAAWRFWEHKKLSVSPTSLYIHQRFINVLNAALKLKIVWLFCGSSAFPLFVVHTHIHIHSHFVFIRFILLWWGLAPVLSQFFTCYFFWKFFVVTEQVKVSTQTGKYICKLHLLLPFRLSLFFSISLSLCLSVCLSLYLSALPSVCGRLEHFSSAETVCRRA